MKLSTTTATTAFSILTFTIGMVFGSAPARSSEAGYLYPVCSPVAHEVQAAWQEGRISWDEAHSIISSCLDYEERQR